MLLLFGAACVGSNLLSGWIAGRFGLRALPVAFAAHAALTAGVSLPAGVVSIANILAVGLLMYVMNSTVQMLFQNVARADYPSALTFSASLHPMSFNAGIALGSFAGGLVVNAGGLLATGLRALFALAAAALALALVRMTARRSVESAAEAAPHCGNRPRAEVGRFPAGKRCEKASCCTVIHPARCLRTTRRRSAHARFCQPKRPQMPRNG
ncbi:MAG: hypothetical protein ACLR3C_05095 [Eggerthella lenta]